MLSTLEFCWWKKAGRNAAQSQHDSLLLCRLVRFVSKTSTGQLEATEINSDVLVISCEICYAPDMWLTAQRLHFCFPSVNTLQVYLSTTTDSSEGCMLHGRAFPRLLCEWPNAGQLPSKDNSLSLQGCVCVTNRPHEVSPCVYSKLILPATLRVVPSPPSDCRLVSSSQRERNPTLDSGHPHLFQPPTPGNHESNFLSLWIRLFWVMWPV